jgi:hypothetical protein
VVNNGGETFKSFAFSGTETLSGTYASRFLNRNVTIPYQGTGTISGTATYTSPTQATISQSTVTGHGTWNAYNVEQGTFQLGSGATVNGSVSGTGKFSGSGSGTIDINGAVTASYGISGQFAGTFNGPQRSIAVAYNQNGLVFNLSGSFVPVATSTFGVTVTPGTLSLKPKTAGSSLKVNVTVQGPVAKVASYTTPAAYVNLYWGNKGKLMGAVLGKVSIDWNEATGNYTFTGLPVPPSTATQLLLYTQIGSTSTLAGTVSLANPTPPVLALLPAGPAVTPLAQALAPAVAVSALDPAVVKSSIGTAPATSSAQADPYPVAKDVVLRLGLTDDVENNLDWSMRKPTWKPGKTTP